MTINKNNDIIMARDDDPYVYVCENTGQLKHKFKLESGPLYALGLSIFLTRTKL